MQRHLARKYPDLRGLADRVKAMHAFEEEGVSLVLSTAHKAKGREWDRVLLWRDFLWKGAGRWLRGEGPPAKVSPELQEEENLFYVAITRAKEHLSLEKLSGNVEEEEEDLSPALIFPLKTKVSSPSSHEGQKVVSLPPEEAPLGLQTMAEADGAWDFILRYLRDRDGSIRFQAYLVYEDILKLSPFLPPGFTAPVPPSYLPTTQEMQRWLDSMTRISEEAGVEGVAWDFLEEEAHLGAIPVKAGSLLEGVSRETLLAFLWFLQAVAIYMGTGKLLYRKIMAGEDPGRVREAFFFAARARRMEILGEALDIGRKWKAVAHTAEGTLVGWYAWAKSHFHERLTSPSDVRFRSGAPPLQDLSYRKDKFPQPSSLAQLEAALRAYAPLTRGREDIFHRRIRYLKKHYGVKGLQALYEALSSGEVDPITCTWLNGPRLAQRLGLEYEV